MSLTRIARRQSFMSAVPLQGEGLDASLPPPGGVFTPAGARFKYDIETYFEGETDAESGMLINLSELDATLATWLEPRAGDTAASFLSALGQKIILKRPFKGARLVKLRLFLDEDHWVDVWP